MDRKDTFQENPRTPSESLRQYLRRRIAELDGVSPEEVTPEYIRKQREKRIYPKLKFDISSDYGGYSGEGRTFLTGEELDALDQEVDDIIAKRRASR